MQLKFGGAEEDENSPNIPASSGHEDFYKDQAMHVALLGNRQNAHRSDIARYPLGLTEHMIGREIDNRRVREEVAKLEAFRRRELEEEVITEMLIEREMISKGVPLLDRRRQGIRTATGIGGIDGRLSLAGPMDNGGFGGFPLPGSKVVVKPIMDLREEQEVSTVNVGAKEDGNCPNSLASSGNKTFYTDQPMHVALPGIRQNAHRSDITRYPSDLNEFLIGREMKNRRIGEEMEKLEVFHQQKLEEQVIRGMRMGREISMPQAGLGLSYVDALLQPDVPGVPFLRRRDGFGTELEHGIDGRLSLAGSMDNGGFGDFPLQGQLRLGVDNGVSLKPIIDLRKEQVVPMPDVSGVPLLSRRDGFGTGIRSGTGIGFGTELEHGIDGRLTSAGLMDNGGFGDFPLQGQPRSGVDNGVSLKPIIYLRKEQVVPMVNPSNSSVTGIKRRFEEPVQEAVEDDTPSVNLRKKARKELKCPLCQVTVSCEQTMKTHMNGKKHKAKERILLQGTSKDWQDCEDVDVGVVEPTEISDNTDARAHDMKERPRGSNADSKPLVDESKNSQDCEDDVDVGVLECTEILEKTSAGAHDVKERPKESNADSKPLVDESKNSQDYEDDVDVGVLERTEILEKTSANAHDVKERPKESNADSKFYCRMCNFGTMCEELMADHRMGEPHWNLLQQNGGCVITIKTTPDNMQYAGEIEDTTAEGEADTAGDDRKGHQ